MTGLTLDAIDPHEWARTGRQTLGTLPLAGMERLCELLQSGAGEIEFTLAGQVLAGGRPVLTGSATCAVSVVCLRCLEPFTLYLDVPIRLSVLRDDAELARLPDGYEPLICPVDQELSLIELVEDELLLALPDHPHHADGMCRPSTALVQQAGKRKPFAALASLRKNDPPSGHHD